MFSFQKQKKSSHQIHTPKLGNGNRSAKEAEPEAPILTEAAASASPVFLRLQWPRHCLSLSLSLWCSVGRTHLRVWTSGSRCGAIGSVIPGCMVSRPVCIPSRHGDATVQYHFDILSSAEINQDWFPLLASENPYCPMSLGKLPNFFGFFIYKNEDNAISQGCKKIKYMPYI